MNWGRIGKRSKRGVSPIIATILLVAITVVLAAVLYVLVSGYLSHTSSAPMSVGWSQVQSSYNTPKTLFYYNTTVQSVSPSGLKWFDIATISLKNSGGGAASMTGVTVTVITAAGGTLTYASGSWTGTNTAVSSGDTLEVVVPGASLASPVAGGSIVLSPTSSYSGTSTIALPS